jgi:hypothetical protein
VDQRDRTLRTAAFGLAAVALAGSFMGYLPWAFGGFVGIAGLGAGIWLKMRLGAADGAKSGGKGGGARDKKDKPADSVVESGLRIAEKPLRSTRPRLTHGLRVTVSTEVAVSLGVRVVCDGPIPEVEALAQTGRRTGARQGVPQFVRESPQSWLFVLRNSPGQRELFLRVDLFSSQAIHVTRVEQIKPGGRVTLPEWQELDQVLEVESAATEADTTAAAGSDTTAAPATISDTAALPAAFADAAAEPAIISDSAAAPAAVSGATAPAGPEAVATPSDVVPVPPAQPKG